MALQSNPAREFSYFKLFFAIFAAIILGVFVWVLFRPQATVSKPLSNLQTFAKCLTDKGAVMFGSDTCINCQNQKKIFGSAFEEISYVNCDFQEQECKARNISVYPVWVFEKSSLIGFQPFSALKNLTGCEPPAS